MNKVNIIIILFSLGLLGYGLQIDTSSEAGKNSWEAFKSNLGENRIYPMPEIKLYPYEQFELWDDSMLSSNSNINDSEKESAKGGHAEDPVNQPPPS